MRHPNWTAIGGRMRGTYLWFGRRSHLRNALIILFIVAAGAIVFHFDREKIGGWVHRTAIRNSRHVVAELTTPIRNDIAANKAKLADVEASIERLTQSLTTAQSELHTLLAKTNAVQAELAELRPKQSAHKIRRYARAALFDAVGLYRKNGRVEVYGTTLRQSQSGPIEVGETVLSVTHSKAMVIWWPLSVPAADATHLRLRFSEHGGRILKPDVGALRVAFKLADGQTYDFTIQLGPKAPDPNPALLPPLYPSDVTEWTSSIGIHTAFTVSADGSLVAPLPTSFRRELDKKGSAGVVQWVIEIDGAAGSDVRISQVALVAPATRNGNFVAVAGRIVGPPQIPGSTVRLLTESGEKQESLLSPSGTFAFPHVPADIPISVRFNFENEDFYAAPGRWFVADADRNDADIRIDKPYFNADGHISGAKTAKFITPRQPSAVAAFYEPHARQYLAGVTDEYPQVYDSPTFTNNWGYVDRDRFVENPGHCLRVVHLGSSHAVSLQVPIGVKYNILMEEELGVKLGRCVEVLSAGRDNGDPGANYRRIRDYAVRFRPAIVILEAGSSLVMQIHPTLLKEMGWDAAHNALDNFYYNDKGELQFRLLDPAYPLFATKQTFPEHVPGVRYYDTLKLPWEQLPPIGREAFKYLGDILKYFRAHHPGITFMLHTAVDQAQCRYSCGPREVKTTDGRTVSIGIQNFEDNIAHVCRENGFHCINLPFPDPTYPLTWFGDGHYNWRGHQWLAHQLSDKLAPELSALAVAQ